MSPLNRLVFGGQNGSCYSSRPSKMMNICGSKPRKMGGVSMTSKDNCFKRASKNVPAGNLTYLWKIALFSVIFNSYVKLPEGSFNNIPVLSHYHLYRPYETIVNPWKTSIFFTNHQYVWYQREDPHQRYLLPCRTRVAQIWSPYRYSSWTMVWFMVAIRNSERLPSGQRLHNYDLSHHAISGKSPIMAMFNRWNYQRAFYQYPSIVRLSSKPY